MLVYSNNELSKKKIEKTIPFIRATKRLNKRQKNNQKCKSFEH